MKIASWNVNSLNVRLPHVEQWLADAAPDVLVLQETKLEDHKFPRAALEAAGYQVVFSGQKTYNGVAILSRQPIRDVRSMVAARQRAFNASLASTRSMRRPRSRRKPAWR